MLLRQTAFFNLKRAFFSQCALCGLNQRCNEWASITVTAVLKWPLFACICKLKKTQPIIICWWHILTQGTSPLVMRHTIFALFPCEFLWSHWPECFNGVLVCIHSACKDTNQCPVSLFLLPCLSAPCVSLPMRVFWGLHCAGLARVSLFEKL